MPNSGPSIFSLFVGINQYAGSIAPLAGCVNDVVAVKSFVEAYSIEGKLDLHTKVLMNEAATRNNIISSFENHLRQVQTSDLALFYFAGYGSQENSHPNLIDLAKYDMLDSLVCHDSRESNGLDLTLVELDTLLGIVSSSQAHVIAILDCSFSGSLVYSKSTLYTKPFHIRQLPPVSRDRNLFNYVLPYSYYKSSYGLSGSQKIIESKPRHKHVKLIASSNFQLAKETTIEGEWQGVFSHKLVKTLQQNQGTTTYSKLIKKVRASMSGFTQDQIPCIETDMPEELRTVFLKAKLRLSISSLKLRFEQLKGWILNVGFQHGLPSQIGREQSFVIAVYHQQTDLKDFYLRSRPIQELEIIKIESDYSLVYGSESKLDPNITYKALIIDIPLKKHPVLLHKDINGKADILKRAIQKSSYRAYLQESHDDPETYYQIEACNNIQTRFTEYENSDIDSAFVIRRSNDIHNGPLVDPIPGLNENSALIAVEQMNHILRWDAVLSLYNPVSQLPTEAVQLELYDVDGKRIETGNIGYTFIYSSLSGEDRPMFTLRLINHFHRPVYCNLLYLSSRFMIENRFFGEEGIWLQAYGQQGFEAWALEGRPLSISSENEDTLTGRRESTEIFKLIISLSEIDTSELRQNAIQPKQSPTKAHQAVQSRGLLFNAFTNNEFHEWNTTEFPIRILRRD